MDIERVIRDYRTGNEDRRIILFLAYRDLRAEFSDIEQEPDGTVENHKAARKRSPSMKMSSISMAVFAVYLSCLGIAFVFAPNPVIAFFGFPPATDVWIRILGYVLAALAFYCFMAVRENTQNFYRWSVYARLPILPAFTAFVVAGVGPPIILLFGAFDSGCALWTWRALKNERRA